MKDRLLVQVYLCFALVVAAVHVPVGLHVLPALGFAEAAAAAWRGAGLLRLQTSHGFARLLYSDSIRHPH